LVAASLHWCSALWSQLTVLLWDFMEVIAANNKNSRCDCKDIIFSTRHFYLH
jgi:hypothetical protein